MFSLFYCSWLIFAKVLRSLYKSHVRAMSRGKHYDYMRDTMRRLSQRDLARNRAGRSDGKVSWNRRKPEINSNQTMTCSSARLVLLIALLFSTLSVYIDVGGEAIIKKNMAYRSWRTCKHVHRFDPSVLSSRSGREKNISQNICFSDRGAIDH